jgi:hypothetical protein
LYFVVFVRFRAASCTNTNSSRIHKTKTGISVKREISLKPKSPVQTNINNNIFEC